MSRPPPIMDIWGMIAIVGNKIIIISAKNALYMGVHLQNQISVWIFFLNQKLKNWYWGVLM